MEVHFLKEMLIAFFFAKKGKIIRRDLNMTWVTLYTPWPLLCGAWSASLVGPALHDVLAGPKHVAYTAATPFKTKKG